MDWRVCCNVKLVFDETVVTKNLTTSWCRLVE